MRDRRLLRADALQQLARRVAAWLEGQPPWVLPSLGILGGGALAWGALQTTASAVVLGVLLLGLAGYQGRQVRVRLAGELPPEALGEGEAAEPPLEPRPPYVIEDPRLTLVMLPAGELWMGADRNSDPQADEDETPRHRVAVSSFAIGQAPVTRGRYRAVLGRGPSEWGEDEADDALPANYVSWEDAVRFCNALSADADLTPCYRETPDGWVWDRAADGYRLPTEAEWEYACRATTETPWFWGAEEQDADRHAWFSGNSGWKPHPVMQKTPNPWGLYDMAGNVWEWCWDWYGRYPAGPQVDPQGPPAVGRRVLRGGAFGLEPRLLRSAFRLWSEPGFRDDLIGFRCVRGSGRQLDN